MRRSVGALDAQTRLAGHHCASHHFVSLNETTASGLPPRHRTLEPTVRPLRLSREPCPFVSNSSANIKSLAFFIFLHSFPSILTCSNGSPCSFSRTGVEPYPRILASWPDPDGFSPPAVHQPSFALESGRGPGPRCGRDSFSALGEDDLPPYEAVEKL
ncbi:unnamed protein product [Prunus armeniaca]